jgi:uncharacterized protein YajQ (UPF0234 family)
MTVLPWTSGDCRPPARAKPLPFLRLFAGFARFPATPAWTRNGGSGGCRHNSLRRLRYTCWPDQEEQDMPSFDVVSEFDAHEATNAIDQANREVTTRFDFKGTGSKYEYVDQTITLTSQTEFQLQQMLDILRQKLAKRGIDIACMKVEEPEISGREARQKVVLRQGIDTPLARDLVKTIKGSKLKVQAAIQGDKLRVTGKKRDDLQAVIALLKNTDVDLPLQFENFRD